MATNFKIVLKKVSNEACKIGCAATIYHLWLQRNKRIHSGNNNIEGIFERLEMMLEGGLVFVKKNKEVHYTEQRTCQMRT